MQMIADGKIKDGFEIKCTDGYDGIYVFRKEELKSKKGSTTIFNRYTLQVFLNVYFEILEDTTEEIEEIEEIHYKERPDKTRGSINSLFDWVAEIETKTNELIRAYNKLNNTTYKAENCMTD